MTVLCEQCGANLLGPGTRPRAVESNLLTLDEAAQYLRVPHHVVQRLRDTGDLPATRIADRAVVRRRDLDAYVNALPSWPSDEGIAPFT